MDQVVWEVESTPHLQAGRQLEAVEAVEGPMAVDQDSEVVGDLVAGEDQDMSHPLEVDWGRELAASRRRVDPL